MRILKKVLWIWLFVLAFSLFNCSSMYDDCNCREPRTNFLEVTSVNDSYQLAKLNGTSTTAQYTDTTVWFKDYYIGFGLNYKTQFTAYHPKCSPATQFSFISSTYACSCAEDSYKIKKVYPVSIKVYNIYSINDSINANSLINEYLQIQGNFNFAMQSDNVQVNTNALLNGMPCIEQYLDIKFYLKNQAIQSDSLKFRIETELNTGEILTTETPLVRFQN